MTKGGQNTSSAVMAQRSEPHDSLDDFPTPPWAVRAFCKAIDLPRSASVWEPAANRGFMVRGLRDHFHNVDASDVHDYGVGFPTHDFLMPGSPLYRPSWIITNPPFRLALEFVERAHFVARDGVAIIVRSVWAESGTRFEKLFERNPPSAIYQHVHRVPMVRGRYDPKASTATGYAWFVWRMQDQTNETRFHWIPDRAADLYRPGDELIEGDAA